MSIKKFFFAAILVSFAFAANAQSTPAVGQTQKNQQKRIVHGVKNGELTKSEVYRLEKQQVRINEAKKDAKADGVVTKKEKVGLHARQKNASKNIYNQKHDRQDRN